MDKTRFHRFFTRTIILVSKLAHFVNFARLYNLKHFQRIKFKVKIKVIDLQKVLYHRKLYSAGKKHIENEIFVIVD